MWEVIAWSAIYIIIVSIRWIHRRLKFIIENLLEILILFAFEILCAFSIVSGLTIGIFYAILFWSNFLEEICKCEPCNLPVTADR